MARPFDWSRGRCWAGGRTVHRVGGETRREKERMSERKSERKRAKKTLNEERCSPPFGLTKINRDTERILRKTIFHAFSAIQSPKRCARAISFSAPQLVRAPRFFSFFFG